MLLLESNWYVGDTNWYLTIFTLFSQMARTRATTTPTPTSARQETIEPATGLWLEEEQRQGVVEEVVGGRPLEEGDEHLAHLILGR